MINTIIKRDNTEVDFDKDRIYRVIQKAFIQNGIDDKRVFNKITADVVNNLNTKYDEKIDVETTQNMVRRMIDKNGYQEIGKSFSKYRRYREKARKSREKLYLKIKNITMVTDRENANVGNGPSSKLLQIAEASSREYAEIALVEENVLDAMIDHKIYPHDFAWASVGTTTCLFIPFRKLLMSGFNTGHGWIRRPKRIRTATQLMCIIFQSNQNEQHGGQASGYFEQELAPFVLAEYRYQYNMIENTLNSLRIKNNKKLRHEEISKLAWERTDSETYQAMESFIANLNTMHSRAGAQVPFTSINIGTGITKEERIIIKNLLLAYEKGLGKGEQPLFPNIIFKVKDGVNYEENTPNHDLLRLAMKVSAIRLFPTYNFQDCSLNKGFGEDVPSMGCRTAVRKDRHAINGHETCESRGNLSFTTINNPGIALECKYGLEKEIEDVNIKFNQLKKKYKIIIPKKYVGKELVYKYFIRLNEYFDIAINQIVERLKYQGEFTQNDFPFLMSGLWLESEKLNPNEKIISVLKHGTLGIGCIGIAETLKCLIGLHYGESKSALMLGLAIIKFMYKKTEIASELYDLNFALLGTPAEGLTGKLLSYDVEKYGIIEGVTDKEWYTNSTHIPVEYKISLFEKIKLEGIFVKYFKGGSITYVELKESPGKNIEAIYTIVKAMHDADVAVGAINFPCDRCLDCGHYGLIDSEECPICNGTKISRIRRITGYLAEIENFNYAKYKEAINRVKHDRAL